MYSLTLPVLGTVAAWRGQARALLAADVPSAAVSWTVGQAEEGLFPDEASALPKARKSTQVALPRAAIKGIETALCHKDPARFARAYGVAWRMMRCTLRWGDRSDPALRRLLHQAKAVHRDIHKMHAFVRFRELEGNGTRRRFAAWFEPEHPITEAATPFFARRFGDMDWVIATPEVTAHFIDGTLGFTETETQIRPPEDDTEALWLTYYASIFNPARLMVRAMESEMPRKYWKNLPEADLIPDLIRNADARATQMREQPPSLPPERVAAIRRAAIGAAKK